MNEIEQIEQSQAGSGRDGGDGVAEQLDDADTLMNSGLQDALDEGYSPPDRPPNIRVPTADEQERGLSLDELLAAEEPDISDDDRDGAWDDPGAEVGDVRAGRLVGTNSDPDDENGTQLWAGDIGIDGAGASAEEAAVHVIDPERDR